MSKYDNDKYMAMSNFVSRLNFAIIEDINPAYKAFANYKELGDIYSVSERRKDYLVILTERNNVPNDVLEIARREAEKWANHFNVEVEYR